MNKKWWETTACWFCDYWWLLLLSIILALALYFTRDLWLPALGLNASDGFVDVTVSQRKIDLELSDNGGEIDGDRIKLLLNGSVILADHTLTGEGTTISLDLKKGINQVVIQALNEGYSSPNTVYVAISHVIEGPSVQVSDGLATGEKSEFAIHAP